jgi:ketosteroid isomerase-like protein
MKRLIATVLLACALFTFPVLAAPPQASSADASAVAAIKQLGQDMGDAMIALDVETIERMFGDDWVSVGKAGSVYTKEMLLGDMKAGKRKLTWFELRPIDVQVFGDVAIAQGNVIEKRLVEGKETDMELVYADILKKREGRWVVVHSIGGKVK